MLFNAYYPVEVQIDYGKLPLYIALCCDASDDFIKLIFTQYTKAAEVQIHNGALPLRIAVKSDASSDIIDMLLKPTQTL
jgi:hypothetical protein